MLKDKKIFITGGAGFIGTQIIKRLYKDNSILIYDNLHRNSIKSTNLLDKVKFVEGDILDLNFLKSTVTNFKPDIIIHAAAIAGIDTVINNPVKTMRVNMIGTYNVLESALEIKDCIERIIDFSTSEVFGSYAYKVNEENNTNLAAVGEARWTYSVSKVAGEHLCHSYFKEFKLPIVTVRPFNVYGPGQVGEGAIHQFVNRAINNEDIMIHGDGDQIRSWCYIDDFVDGIILCLENEKSIGNVFNIGNPKGTVTIGMLAKLIKILSESKSQIKYIPKGYADVELRIPSVEKAEKILDFKAKIDLEEGLIRTIDWYKNKAN